MGLIYKVSNNINDKVYIGQTVQPLVRRWQSHLSDAKCPHNHFHRAMNKYGVEHFSIEVIESNVPENLLNEREQYWIAYYDSYYNGYNSTKGGDCGNFPIVKIYQYDLNGNFYKSLMARMKPSDKRDVYIKIFLKYAKER